MPTRKIGTLILDLDGPILDGHLRHFACYSAILATHGFEPLDIAHYWDMKRRKASLRTQLAATGAERIESLFMKMWLDYIEQPEFLILDSLQPGAKEKLQQWQTEGVRLVVVTLRQEPSNLYAQLSKLEIDRLFHAVLVCQHKSGAAGKANAVRTYIPDVEPETCVWIGDSEVDTAAAREFGCTVWSVGCGIRNEVYLRSLRPDFYSSDLASVDIRWHSGS